MQTEIEEINNVDWKDPHHTRLAVILCLSCGAPTRSSKIASRCVIKNRFAKPYIQSAIKYLNNREHVSHN